MTDAGVFGPSKSTHDVTAAMQAHLTAWLPTELARFARKYGYAGGLQMVRFTRRRQFTNWPGDLAPLVILVCPGTVDGTVTDDGAGNLSGAFLVEVAALAESTDEEEAIKLGSAYWEAVREAIVQHGALGVFAERTDFVGEDTDRVLNSRTDGAERTLAANSGRFHVWVRNFTNRLMGPEAPLPAPYDEPADAQTPLTTDLEIVKESP